MKEYCITWGEIGIQSFVFANSEDEAIAKLKSDFRNALSEDFEPNIKHIEIIE